MHCRRLLPLVLLATASPLLALPATTASPTTAPAAAAMPAEAPSLHEALAALQSGDPKRAASLADACITAARRSKVRADDAVYVNAAHIQGVAFLRLAQPKQAADALQKCVRAAPGNRSLLYNVSVGDIQGKQSVARAVENLRGYAVAHPDDADIVNLWGMAIDAAARDRMTPKIEAAQAAYAKVDKQLEAARPGMHRWGTEWLDQDRWNEIESQRRAVQPDIDSATKRLATVERNVAKIKAQIAEISAPMNGAMPGGDSAYRKRIREDDLKRLNRKLDDAEHAANDCRAELKAATDRLPKPAWAMRLEPIEPEMID